MVFKNPIKEEIFYFLLLSLFIFTNACTSRQKENATEGSVVAGNEVPGDSILLSTPPESICELEQSLIDAGLVNVQELDTTILVKLKYSTNDNFFGFDVYGSLENAYLQAEVAAKLAKAQQLLKETHPEYNLLVYDGVRPRRVQQILWDTVDVPASERPKYVADPKKGSLHNYGAAVDLTIAGKDGQALDMGTTYDYFGILAHPAKEEEMIAGGKLSGEQVFNRQLLRKIMQEAGFSPITSEWWHFNGYSLKDAQAKFAIIE